MILGKLIHSHVAGNVKYERGEDNKLIIWSKGHDGVTTPNKQATSTTAPRLPYQRLLSRMSSSSPDCSSSMKPSSPLAAEEVSSYQKLVKSSCRPVSEGCRYGREVIQDATDKDQQRAYQCLSLQRNPMVTPLPVSVSSLGEDKNKAYRNLWVKIKTKLIETLYKISACLLS